MCTSVKLSTFYPLFLFKHNQQRIVKYITPSSYAICLTLGIPVLNLNCETGRIAVALYNTSLYKPHPIVIIIIIILFPNSLI